MFATNYKEGNRMITFSKIALTMVLLFSSVEFIRSCIQFYFQNNQTLEVAGKVGNSGSILILTVAVLLIIKEKK